MDRASLLRRLLFVLLLAAFAAGAVGLQRARLQHISHFRPYEDSLILPRTEYVKLMAFGYDAPMADFLYLRSIQAFGGQWRKPADQKNYEDLYHYFYSVAALDPQFLDIYEFGSMIIGEEAGDVPLATELLEQGWLKNPDKYKLPYLAGYMNWWGKKNELQARLWIQRALDAPDCPSFVRRMLPYFDRESGRFEASAERWVWEYFKGVHENSGYLLALAERQLRDTTNRWNLQFLNDAARSYVEDHGGVYPQTIEQLQQGGYLESSGPENERRLLQFHPLWATMQMLRQQEGLETSPDSQEADNMIRALLERFVGPPRGLPRSPYDKPDAPDPYVVRRDQTLPRAAQALEDNELVVNLQYLQDEILSFTLGRLRRQIDRFHRQNGYYPLTLHQLPFRDGFPHEPLTLLWDYNPATGEIKSPNFPEL